MMKSTLLSVLFIFFSLFIKAQFIPFAYTYGGNGVDMGYDVIETDDSGYVCVGQIGSDGYTFGSSDVYVLKTDINGQLLWRKNYGGMGVDAARSITKGHGGGFLISGFTNSFGNGGYDYYALRIDEQGELIWYKTYGGLDWDFAYASCSTSDGNYLIAGETFSYGAGGSDVWVLKIDDNGDTLSTFLWGTTGDQTCKDIKEFEPGIAVLIGDGVFSPSADRDAFLLAYNHLTGSNVFESVTSYIGTQEMKALDSSHAGGFVTFGVHKEEGHSDDLFIQYYSSSGNILANHEIAGSNEQYNLSINSGLNHKNQSYYVAGSSQALGSNDYEALFFMLDPLPYVTLGRVLTSSGYNGVNCIIETADKGILMAGIADGYGPGPTAALLWKLDSLGASSPVLPLLATETIDTPSKINIYPNPTSSYLYVDIPIGYTFDNVFIRSASGQLVYTMSHTGLKAIDVESLVKGIYFIELESSTGQFYRTKFIKL